MAKLVITDYGVGNLLSITRAFETGCDDVTLESDPKKIAEASHLVVPGVGAFGQCVASLKEHGFYEPVMEHVKAGKPFLGVCVGMQMLFESSNEFGSNAGLGLIKGHVKRIDAPDYKIPNIGWERLRPVNDWQGTVLQGLGDDSYVYLVHSYAGQPEDMADCLATYRIGDTDICAAVQKDNVIGTQFHPEKSGHVGLEIIKRFCEMA